MLPAIAGLLFNRFRIPGLNGWEVMLLVSMAGIAIILVITLAGRDHLLQVGGWLVVATLCITWPVTCWLLVRLPVLFHERDCRTIALEVRVCRIPDGFRSGPFTGGNWQTTGWPR